MPTPKVNIRLPSVPEIEVHLEGEWVKVTNLINGMPQSVLRGYQKGITSISRQILIIVRRAIRTHQPPPGSGVRWAPLSKSTLKAHGQHGIYKLTGTYLRAVNVFNYKGRVVVGLPYNQRAVSKNGKVKGITLNQVAIILEHGSNLNGDGGIPSRPLWKPSYKSYGGHAKVKKTILRSIRSELIRNHGLNSSQIRQV